jgi:enoyl-CoA hydratase
VTYETIELTREDGIATVTLNRPERLNALSRRMLEELGDVFQDLGQDQTVGVVILTGGPKAFSAGADLKEASASVDEMPTALWRQGPATVFDQIERIDKITIAAIAGYAMGGGLELALVCDLRIAATNARLGLPEVKVGIIPAGGGTQRLPRAIGATRAKELMLLCDPISAERAEQIGLVNRVVEPDALMEEARALARTILERPPLAARAIKSCVNAGMQMELPAGLEYEGRIATILLNSEDRKEGMQAFVEKRAPVFTGR